MEKKYKKDLKFEKKNVNKIKWHSKNAKQEWRENMN